MLRWERRKANRAQYMLKRSRERAFRLGVECDLTIEWFETKLAGVCELTGFPFDLEATGKQAPDAPSVDRIKAGGAYTQDNCRLVLWSINRALSSYGEEYMVKIFTAFLAPRGV